MLSLSSLFQSTKAKTRRGRDFGVSQNAACISVACSMQVIVQLNTHTCVHTHIHTQFIIDFLGSVEDTKGNNGEKGKVY